ncbi:sensor histidine kinase [Viridibacterium curvum]|uniref:histidine kinase n=1 Tax=Viridibacterium curvum TaxID=1101404 RepID=A0ABP9QRB5_9RHOO
MPKPHSLRWFASLKWATGLFALLAALLCASVLAQSTAGKPTTPPKPPAPTRLDQAQILFSDALTPPPDSAAWQPQQLPDNWSLTRPGVGGFAWYRIEFTLNAKQLQLSALHVPKVSMNGAAFINGEFVGSGGRFTEPIARQWYRPQIYVIPKSLLVEGRNVIHYRVKAYANDAGGLSELYFGVGTPVAEMWRDQYFWQLITVQMTSALSVGLSSLALLAWMLRRWSSAYGYYGASVLLWGIRNTHFLFRDLPLPVHYWELLVSSSQIWVALLMFMFVLRFENLRRPWLERGMAAFAVLAPCVLWAVDALQFRSTTTACYAILLLIGTYILGALARVAWRDRSAATVLLLGATSVVFGLSLHAWLVYANLLDYSTPYYLHYGPPVLFIAVAWNMFVRFAQAQDEADHLTRTLESRIEEKSAELALTHERIRAAEAANLRIMERERFMQDMHDGLGSQLVSSLAMAQAGELSREQTYELLRSCIDDLRLAIDTSNDADDSLALALGNLRFRMEPRLKSAGIALQWHAELDHNEQSLPPECKLPILRIVQESITNTLKHARARTLWVSISQSPTALVIEVRDDGCGFKVDATRQGGQGKGLNSLDKRARTLGAELLLSSSPAGTTVRLTLPLPRPGDSGTNCGTNGGTNSGSNSGSA